MKHSHKLLIGFFLLIAIISGIFISLNFLSPENTDESEAAKPEQNSLTDEINEITKENKKILEENKKQQQELAYKESDQFTDKYEKMNLGLLNPGEKIIIIENQSNKESESDNTYENNTNEISAVETKINDFFIEKNIEIQDTKLLDTEREFHIQNQEGIWIWLNLMIDIDPQLNKLDEVLKKKDELTINEYIDLRIPGKIFIK